jgi:hypothetical protein
MRFVTERLRQLLQTPLSMVEVLLAEDKTKHKIRWNLRSIYTWRHFFGAKLCVLYFLMVWRYGNCETLVQLFSVCGKVSAQVIKGLCMAAQKGGSPSRWCLHFVVVGGLAWSNDSESYAGGSVATGRVSHAGLVEGDDRLRETPPSPRC